MAEAVGRGPGGESEVGAEREIARTASGVMPVEVAELEIMHLTWQRGATVKVLAAPYCRCL
jgi:hypothetical protein